MATSTFAQYGMASTETASNGFTGTSGVPSSRKSMPLALVAYEIDFEFDGSGDVITLATSTGVASGDVTGVKATGTITFTGLPTANDTVTINGTVYTFKASAATATEITIGATATETASNTASKIDANETIVDAVNVLGVVTISAANTGEYGNAYTLAESAANTTVSGATLSGGVDKVIITGDGVDFEGTALPTMAKVHGILVTVTSGSVTAALGSVIKDTITTNGGFQTWNSTGRTDLIGSLTLTSAAANTAGTIVIRASE
jgi:hypothetical protein